MAKPPPTIHVDPDSEPAHALHGADEAPVAPQSNSARVRVSGDGAPWAGYDPERVRASRRRFAGMPTPEEGERLQQLIDRAREEGTQPPDRPRGRIPNDPDP